MEQIILAWSTRYGASIFYNYVEKESYVECIMVISLNDDVEIYRGSSKTVNNLKLNVKPKLIAKTLAQAAALNGYMINVIDHTTNDQNAVLDITSHDIIDVLEEEDEDE